MANGYDIKPATLNAAGGQFSAAGDQVANGLSAIRDTVSGDGNPWGSDEPGTIFGQLYVAAMSKALEVIGEYAQQLQQAGEALTAIGTAVREGDQRQADAYLELLKDLK